MLADSRVPLMAVLHCLRTYWRASWELAKTRMLFPNTFLPLISGMNNARGRIWLIHIKLEMHPSSRSCSHGEGTFCGRVAEQQWLEAPVKGHFHFWRQSRGLEGRQPAMSSSLGSAILTVLHWTSYLASLYPNILNEYAQDTQNGGDKNSTFLTRLMRGWSGNSINASCRLSGEAP